MSDQPSVLFVCVHNAGRSQMAAGWLTHLAGDTVEVRSAGSMPKDSVNPAAVEAMAQTSATADVQQVMSLLRSTRPIAEATRATHLQNPKITPLMEPLLPALNRTVRYWGSYTQTLSVVHDEQ